MDYLTSFIIWSLATFGAANIIVFSAIFKPLRDKLANIKFLFKLVNCILCMGFWVGVFWGFTVWNPSEYFVLREHLPYQFIFDAVFNGSLGSCVSWIFYLLLMNRMSGK